MAEDKKLSILIELLTKEVGQEKAADILKRVREETAKASTANDQSAESTKRAAKESGNLIEKTGTLNKALNMLRGELGIVGRLSQFVFNPLTLAVAAASIAIAKIRERWAEWKREIEETKQKLLDLNQTKFDALVKATSAAATAQADYNRVMKEAGKDQDAIKTAFDKRVALLDAEEKKIRALIKAQEDLEIARFRAANPNDPAGEQKIRDKYNDLRERQDAKGEAAKLKLLEEERDTRQTEAARLKADADRYFSVANKMPLDSGVLDAQAQLEQLKKENSVLAKRAQDAGDPAQLRAKLEEAKKDLASPFAGDSGKAFVPAQLEKQIAAADKAVAALLTNAEAQADLQRRLDDWMSLQKDFAAKGESASRGYLNNADRVRDLNQQIETTREVNSINEKARRQTQTLPGLTAGLTLAEEIADGQQRGRPLPKEQAFHLQSFGSMVAGKSVDIDTAANMFREAGRNRGIEKQFLDRLLRVVEDMNSTGIEALNQRLDLLEQQFKNSRRR